jgi:hypothetical protein
MYQIFTEPRVGRELLDEWVSTTGDFDQIKGYTDIGDVFLINSKTGEIGILMTMTNGFHDMGYYDWDEFSSELLSNPKFQEKVMSRSLIEEIKEHCGELGDEEVYFPVPYPCVGGSGAADTYKKGNVWVYLAISSQTWSQV